MGDRGSPPARARSVRRSWGTPGARRTGGIAPGHGRECPRGPGQRSGWGDPSQRSYGLCSFVPPAVSMGDMRKASGGLVVVLGLLGAGCGSVSDNHPTPNLVPGGGIGSGKINGYLNVYVTDDDTRAPIMGASVRVGPSANSMPCEALTDSTGLATFDPQSCKSLNGPVTVTASDSGYAPSTWIGADGANMTMTIRAMHPTPVDTATVSGTIAGWESLPAPATGHNTIAIIAASQAPNLGDRGNNLTQPMR